MDKNTLLRTVLAMVLSVVIILGSQYYFKKMYPAPAPVPTDPALSTSAAPQTNVSSTFESVDTAGFEATADPSLAPVLISTNDYDLAFEADTGDVLMVGLKRFNGESIPPTFKNVKGGAYGTLNAGISTGFTHKTEETGSGTTIIFTAENEQIRVEKRYSVTDGYYIPMEVSITNLGSSALSIPLKATVGPGFGDGFDLNRYVFEGPIMANAKGIKKETEDDVEETLTLDSPLWGGYTSKYFLFSYFADAFSKAEIVQDGSSAQVVMSGSVNVPPTSTVKLENTALYVGPKVYNDLKAYGNGLQKSIDFGVFFFLGIPMTKVMNFAYGFTHNYGIAIIILTIIVRLITLPLTLKSTLSMKAMAKLQPEMLVLREKYKGEPQKLNAATMELYRKHKVNPLAGCLPLIIQLPIFFALYKSLLVSIELKGAPFFGWIVDLSVKDPYYITPILMGASMFIQQKLTPSTMDPMQQKIFLIMPVVFTFLFLNFQSGLVVYWLTNNLLSIIQQVIINKRTT